MPKVRFVETCVTREARPQTFEAGRVYELAEASCEYWRVRGKVVDVEDDGRPLAAVPAPIDPLTSDVPFLPKPGPTAGDRLDAPAAGVIDPVKPADAPAVAAVVEPAAPAPPPAQPAPGGRTRK